MSLLSRLGFRIFLIVLTNLDLLHLCHERAEHEEMVLVDMYLRPGEAWEYCPREVLQCILKVLKEEFNWVCLITPEFRS